MVSASAGRSAKAKAREFKASGNKAMAAGAFAKAARQYGRALELDPGNAILYSNRSATHFNLRQFAESLEDAESAVLCDDTWWKAYKRKGLALIHMQRYEEAIEALEAGLAIVGENREMEKNLEFARACQEQAQNLYILPEPNMMERLESVPVFIVTDDVGQPFFVTYEDGQQVCTFYFDKVDADATLVWIQDENPDIGGTARVIHITLNQAFSLAQETQKQYYEETTRAAVEEDRAAAREAAEKKVKPAGEMQADVDGEAGDETMETGAAEEADAADAKEAAAAEAAEAKAAAEAAEATAAAEAVEAKAAGEAAGAAGGEAAGAAGAEEGAEGAEGAERAEGAEGGADDAMDDSIIDENAPLSFQFRPELRQVQVAVELLNKNPNPPVRPILRDPPSVKEAKAKAKAEEEVVSAGGGEEGEGRGLETKDEANEGGEEKGGEKKGGEEVNGDEEAKQADEKVGGEEAKEADEKVGGEETTEGEEKKGAEETVEAEKTVGDAEAEAEADGAKAAAAGDDDEELTVENFNGIPVFQAKGLTLLQNGQQLLPLFCSKWDLEAAWDQLVASPGSGVSGKCDVEVGTLEDVLRRMSESKTGEFDNVIFVPSRESMTAIGQRFPLDELSARTKPVARPPVKKASFSRAKEIKARGGTQEEIRAAVEEDLKLFRERQRMAEMVASLNQAAPAAEQSPTPAAARPAAARRPVASEKPMSGHERREVLRKKREAGGTKDAPGVRVSQTSVPAPAKKPVAEGTEAATAGASA